MTRQWLRFVTELLKQEEATKNVFNSYRLSDAQCDVKAIMHTRSEHSPESGQMANPVDQIWGGDNRFVMNLPHSKCIVCVCLHVFVIQFDTISCEVKDLVNADAYVCL